MLRKILSYVAVLAALVPASSAFATDYSKVRCENPRVISYMATELPKMSSTLNGSGFSQRFSSAKIISSSTYYSDPGKIICELTIDLGARGMTHTVRSRFSMQQMPSGKTRFSLLSAY